MLQIREKNEDLDKVMSEYENYIEKNGLPYCDYKVSIFALFILVLYLNWTYEYNFSVKNISKI